MATSSYVTSSITFQTRSNPIYGFGPVRTINFYNQEEMVSQNHYPLNVDGDSGGPWLLTKRKDHTVPAVYASGIGQNVKGEFTVSAPPAGNWSRTPTPSAIGDLELISLGTTAIARVEPTKSAFDATVAIGEVVKDGLPSMVGLSLLRERAQIARGAGKEYLNAQFGWVPLISDLRKLAKAVKESEATLHAYRKGGNVKQRRRYSFPPENRTRSYTGSLLPYPSDLGYQGHGGLFETYRKETWFSGAFKYHIPVSDGQLSNFEKWSTYADHILGVEVTPESLWNLAPWSWAIDWFTNTGDILHNISAMGSDGLVMQYGYIMQTKELSEHMYATFSVQWEKLHTTRTISTLYKRRLPATPYGFGTDLSGLSSKQVAILVALGLSRT